MFGSKKDNFEREENEKLNKVSRELHESLFNQLAGLVKKGDQFEFVGVTVTVAEVHCGRPKEIIRTVSPQAPSCAPFIEAVYADKNGVIRERTFYLEDLPLLTKL